MRRRLVVLSCILCVSAGLGCPSSLSGTARPAPELGEPDAGGVGGQDPGGGVAEVCDNGIDDDRDGWIDCYDGACWYAAVCTPDPQAEPEPDTPRPVCGNWVLEGDEECDDGNVLSDDGCDGACRTEPAAREDDWGDPGDPAEPGDPGDPDDPGDPGDPGDPADPPPLQDVTAGERVDAGIDPLGDQDWYRIWLEDGDRLVVETSDGEGSCMVDTVAQLFGATLPDPLPASTSCEDEADDLTCDDDGGPGMCSLLEHSASASDFVHVRVLAFGDGETGDYSVTFTVLGAGEPGSIDELEPNDSPDEANAIATGDVVEGEIDVAGDEDYFTLDVRAFETVRIETSDGEGGCGLDSVLTLYAGIEEPSEGTTCLDDLDAFACDDDDGIGTCSMLEQFFWMDETILARVTSFGQLSIGTYSMAVSIQ